MSLSLPDPLDFESFLPRPIDDAVVDPSFLLQFLSSSLLTATLSQLQLYSSTHFLLNISIMRLRVSSRLLATATSVGTTKGFKPAPMALLPPISLYRRLFRAHRKHLPREMRLLGDEYIKSEFRAHRNVENPVHIVSAIQRMPWKGPVWTSLKGRAPGLRELN